MQGWALGSHTQIDANSWKISIVSCLSVPSLTSVMTSALTALLVTKGGRLLFIAVGFTLRFFSRCSFLFYYLCNVFSADGLSFTVSDYWLMLCVTVYCGTAVQSPTQISQQEQYMYNSILKILKMSITIS